MADRLNDYRNPQRWTRMALEDLKTPKPGRLCVGPAYWAVHEGDVLFFKGHSPQCNRSEAVIRHVRPDCEIVFVDMAFVPHRCSDYV